MLQPAREISASAATSGRGNSFVTAEVSAYGDAVESQLVTCVLVAEPDPVLGRLILQACGDRIRVIECRGFHAAREHLLATPLDALVTNLRLRDYNGLHLVLIANAANRRVLSVVHTDRRDPYLIREAQAIGAFFEPSHKLPQTLAGYLRGRLPPRDRRNPENADRRGIFRGGRRGADRPAHV